MAMEGKINIVKYLVFFFNLLFWLSGVALIIIGSIVMSKYGDYLRFADAKFVNAAALLIGVGVIVFVIGFLGCCGAAKENHCMMATFAVLLSIIFILEIVAGILGFVFKNKVKDVAEDTFKRALRDYDTLNGAKRFYDWAQKKFKCCGYNNSSDWKTVPKSCCIVDNYKVNCTKSADNIFKQGCKDDFNHFVSDHLLIIGGVGIGIAFLQILGISFACCLMREIKAQYEVV